MEQIYSHLPADRHILQFPQLTLKHQNVLASPHPSHPPNLDYFPWTGSLGIFYSTQMA